MIFLDVGAHDGQTLEEVTKRRYGFSAIYAFEPMPAQYETLVERFGDNRDVRLFMFGLSDRDGVFPLYGHNRDMEASIYPEKRDVDSAVVTNCCFVSASAFFRDVLTGGEKAIVKLNCEGSEIPILDDLLDSGEITKAHVMIDFDIRKVRGRQHDEERILRRFEEARFTDYVLSEEVMVGETHQERIAAWLEGVL